MAATVKLPLLVAGPETVVTDIVPVVAPGITMPTKVVEVLDTTIAVVPPIVKTEGLAKPAPVIVTNVPTGPLEGVNEEIIVPGEGNGVDAREPVLVTVVPLTPDISISNANNKINVFFILKKY